MFDKKRRLFNLIEYHINDYNSKVVEVCYGKGAKIKIHSMTEIITYKGLLFEVVIILGETINESVMDKTMAEVLLKDSLVYFYPEIEKIKCMVRFDV